MCVARKIVRETMCKKITLKSNGCGNKSCCIEAVAGKGLSLSTEKGIAYT